MEGDVKELSWPWIWDNRPHGWFKAMGGDKFGPLPQREPNKQQTWPPRSLETPTQMTQADMIKKYGL
jgi:hypothetical protein